MIKALNIAAILILLINWIFVIINYSSLPDSVPVHFDFTGKPDKYGNKITILGVPTICTLLLLFMIFIKGKFLKQQDKKDGKILLSYIGLIISFIFLFISVSVVFTSKRADIIPTEYFFYGLLLMILIPVIITLIKTKKGR